MKPPRPPKELRLDPSAPLALVEDRVIGTVAESPKVTWLMEPVPRPAFPLWLRMDSGAVLVLLEIPRDGPDREICVLEVKLGLLSSFLWASSRSWSST